VTVTCPTCPRTLAQHCRGEHCGWLMCGAGHIVRARDGHVSGHPTPEAPQ
jgi:hypothetical protein